VRLKMRFRDVPGRFATGSFILHSGLEKWSGDEQRAAAVHQMASGAFPKLKDIPPTRFLRILSASEVALGTALLSPVVSGAAAGAALCGFSGSLLVMYWRTESMHKPNSPWPTQAGTAISKDVWMLGIGAGLVLSSFSGGRRKTSSKRKSR
jgi:uncharacterized membrane protein YphA (DoxX/SURF4 family)